MKLEIDCSWNEGKNSAKETICFDHQPEGLFKMPKEKILEIQALSQAAPTSGPKALEEIKRIKEIFTDSLYATMIYYQTLCFFEFIEEAEQLLKVLKKKHPKELLIRCAIASKFLKEKKTEDFYNFFRGLEVLVAAFPERKEFFFEEALFFHDLWIHYHMLTGNEIQAERHKKFNLLLINTFKSMSLV